MPVLGHAFVGLATAIYTRPSRSSPAGSGLWLPIVVAVAYLPDIVNHVILTLGWGESQVISHSILFAIGASIVLGIGLSRFAKISTRSAVGVVLFSILCHDALDLLQATGRMPWWPLARWRIGFGLAVIPADVSQEALLFGGLFVLFLAWRWFFRREASGRAMLKGAGGGRHARWVWPGYVVTALILVSATVTHYLHGIRQRQLHDARALLSEGDYTAALGLADQARRWPFTGKPGRIEYLKAVAYEGLGDERHAERLYLRAVRLDPTYFWSLADLAVMYASSDAPLSVRRPRAARCVQELRTRFATHDGLPRVLEKLERKLSELPGA